MVVRKPIDEPVLHTCEPPFRKSEETGTSSLKAVYRAADIIRCLQRAPMTLSEIAGELDVHKSTAHRLLQALKDADLVVRSNLDRRFYLGSLISELVSDPEVTHQYLVSCALNPMKQLARFTGESIGLNILIGLSNILLFEIPSTHNLHIVAKKKVVNNLYAGSGSKVLLAQLEPKELMIAVSNLDYKPLTERTITSKEELLAQVNRIKAQGYAMCYGERIAGAMNIAVPVRNYFVPSAIGILGLESRMKPRTAEYLKALQEAGSRIEDNISSTLF